MPQKRYEDLIRTFHILRRIKPGARLVMVGGWDGLEAYRDYLDGLVEHYRLDKVIFTGRVSDAELWTLFQEADVYLCLSDHEGFCVPLVEAMGADLPIVAKKSTAVGETLGPAGVLLDDPSPSLTAEVIAALTDDPELIQDVRDSQHRRLADFHTDVVWNRLWSLLKRINGHDRGN